MKAEHGKKPTEISMIRWTCGSKLNERKVKNSENCWDWNQSVKKSRSRWFGHVDCKDWVKHCMALKVYGIREDVRRSGRTVSRWTWKV